MTSTQQTPVRTSRARLAALLAVLGLLAPVAAGCGGGGGGGGEGGDEGQGTGTATKADKPPRVPPGSVVRNLRISVASRTSARVTATLGRATEVSLQVRRLDAAGNSTRIGRVSFGRKPAGPVTINWDLKVEGRQLAPGRYQGTLRGKGSGRSRPATFTIPS